MHTCETFIPAHYIGVRGRKQKCWMCTECGKLLRLDYISGCLVAFETERARLVREARMF